MPDLAKKYSDIFWYCNTSVASPDPDYLQTTDSAGIAYTAGVAARIALRDSDGDASR
jgi:hypothetical protein